MPREGISYFVAGRSTRNRKLLSRTNVRAWLPWGFPGKNTGVGCHFLLQEIFPTTEDHLRESTLIAAVSYKWNLVK